MVGSESRSSCVLSWADEVEREEHEEAAQPHLHQTQKLIPFGSARPREVVLQERGIDWRLVDQDLLPPPSSDWNKHRNEKPQRENLSAPAANKEQSALRKTSVPEQAKAPAPMVPVARWNQIPLRYPPKNVVAHWIEKPCISQERGWGGFRFKNRLEPEKENVFMSNPRNDKERNLRRRMSHIENDIQSNAFEKKNREAQRSGPTEEAVHDGRRRRLECGHGRTKLINRGNLVLSSMVNEKRDRVPPHVEKDRELQLDNGDGKGNRSEQCRRRTELSDPNRRDGDGTTWRP